MKIEFCLHRREHCLRANKRMKRWPAAVLWLTVGQLPIFLTLTLTPSLAASLPLPVSNIKLKQLLDCQGVDVAQSQQTNVEDYLSQSVEAAEERDIGWKEMGGKQKEWMNRLKNGNLMTAKLLINLADTGTVCVCAHMCVLVRSVCPLSLREYNTSHSKSRLWD